MPIREESLLINLRTRNYVPFNFQVTLKVYEKFLYPNSYHTLLDKETYSKAIAYLFRVY